MKIRQLTYQKFGNVRFSPIIKCGVSRTAQPASNIQYPAPRTPHPATRNPHRASSIQLFVSLLIFILTCLFGIDAFASNPEKAADLFAADIRKLSSFGDRSTGSKGNEAAAAYIKDRFSALGIETVGSHQFDVATIKPKNSTLTIPQRGLSIPIRPIRGNAVTPQTIPAPGIKAPLIYVGNGDFVISYDWDTGGWLFPIRARLGKAWIKSANTINAYVELGTSSPSTEWYGPAANTSVRVNFQWQIPVNL